jgi:hypothetical protein
MTRPIKAPAKTNKRQPSVVNKMDTAVLLLPLGCGAASHESIPRNGAVLHGVHRGHLLKRGRNVPLRHGAHVPLAVLSYPAAHMH